MLARNMGRHWRAPRQRAPELEHREVRRRQDDPDIKVTVSNRGADDPYRPNAGGRRGSRCALALSENRSRADETDAGNHALQDICLGRRIRPEDDTAAGRA